MTKNEQNRLVAWRSKVLREASDLPRGVAQTCRHFGLSRQAFYKWRARYKSHGEAGLCDRPRVQQSLPPTRAPPADGAAFSFHSQPLVSHRALGPGARWERTFQR